MKHCWILCLLLTDFNAARAQEMVRWSFENSDRAITRLQDRVELMGSDANESAFSDNTPGKFIYDPLTRESRANATSRRFAGSERTSQAVSYRFDPSGLALDAKGLTIEAFIQPHVMARGDAWIAGFTRKSAEASELALQWIELRNSHQTWHGAEVTAPQSQTQRWPVGHYSSSTRLDSRVEAWRHVAVVYDNTRKVATAWVDYHLSQSVPVAAAMHWDGGNFLIGGRPDHWGIEGLIDEVRVTTGVLGPADFLRARDDALEGVSFRSDQQIAPVDAGCLDLKEHFGAVGDGKADDTQAFNTAFAQLTSRVPLAYNTLLIPPGEYLVSDMLYCSRFIDVKGAGPGNTVIRLRDRSPAYQDPLQPRPVLRMSSTSGDPGSHRGVNGSSISIYLDGVTIDTGVDNPGAKGLEYHSNNLGRLENVVIRSGDGRGVVGLDLTHHDVGPALVKQVTVDGFDLGVAIRYQEYSMTFEHLRLRNQRVAGIRNQGNILAVRGLVSENTVPAFISEGPNSMVTLIDSRLSGGAPEASAIISEGGLYLLRLQTTGYGKAVTKRQLIDQNPQQWQEAVIVGPDIGEFAGDQITRGFGTAEGALKMAIEETPEPPARPVSEWVNLANFEHHKVGEDWGPAVQAAIDSGARVIYAPANLPVQFHTPIELRGVVERLVGFGKSWNWSDTVWKASADRQQTDASRWPPPLVTFTDDDPGRTVWIDRLSIQSLAHGSKGTLVLRSSSPDHYRTSAGGGRLFAEDVGGADWHFEHPQAVWVRQWNPESHSAGPCIHSRGASIWALGFKTEYESQKLLAEQDARTEILGAFIYPIGEIPQDRPLFENRDSRMSLVYGTSVYQSNHQVQIRDVRGSHAVEIGPEKLRWAGSRGRMDLFVTE